MSLWSKQTQLEKVVTFEITNQPSEQPITLSTHDWHQLHNEWLNTAMQAAMGNQSLQDTSYDRIMCWDSDHIGNKEIYCSTDLRFAVRCNLHIKAKDGNSSSAKCPRGTSGIVHKDERNWQKCNHLPMAGSGSKTERNCINKPQDILQLLSKMKKYQYKLIY